jgi:hypothetical protein
MMSENLFKNSDCPIQSVPQVDFDFVTVDVCTPIPAPPPIFGCVTPIVPREPGTEVGLTCPAFGPLSVEVNSSYYVTEEPGGALVVVKTGTDPCEYEFALNLNIPIPKPPCPAVNSTTLAVSSGFADCLVETENTFTIDAIVVPGDCETADQCLFDFALNLAIPIPRTPCPTVNVNSFQVSSGFSDSECMTGTSNQFNVSSRVTPGDCNTPDQCDFDIDLEIAIPIPRPPCPVVRDTALSVTTGFSDCLTDPNNRFVVDTFTVTGDCNTPNQCLFDFDLNLEIPIPRPPCPRIYVNDFRVWSGFDASECADGAENYFQITSVVAPGDCNNPDQCDFAVDVSISVPIPRAPCPNINLNDFQVNTGFSDSACMAAQQSYFTITPSVVEGGCNTADQCAFDLDVNIAVPIPRAPCPSIYINNFSVATGFSTPGTDDVACLDAESYFNITPVVTPGDCNTPDQCDFAIDLEIAIPIPRPACPNIGVTNFSVTTGFSTPGPDGVPCIDGDNHFVVTPVVIPGDCNNPDQCDFELDLALAIPIPRPACPVIRVSNFSVRSGFATAGETGDACFNDENRFVVTPVINPGDCNNPDQCEFDVDLVISVPVPRPPCPIIRVDSLAVTTGYAGLCAGENRFEINTNVIPGDCNTPDQCEFTVDLEILVPVPPPVCPTIHVDRLTVVSGYSTCVDGDSSFVITPVETPPTCDSPGTCDYAVDLDIVVPIPVPTCPIISAGAVSVYTGYVDCEDIQTHASQLTITPSTSTDECGNPACDFEIDIDIVVPLPKPDCPQIFAVSSFFGAATGSFSITPSTNAATCENGAASPPTCDYLVELSVNVPVAGCPRIVAEDGVLVAGYYEENSFRLNPSDPVKDEEDNCVLALAPEVRVKIPVPPCTLWAGGVTVIPGEPGSAPGGYYEDGSSYDPGNECVIAPQLVLNIPTSCVPQFFPQPGTVYMVSPTTPSRAEIFVERIEKTCNYKITPYLHVPKYVAPCATFDTTKTAVYLNGDKSQKVSAKLDIRSTSQDPETGKCKYDAILEIDLPYCKYELRPDPAAVPSYDDAPGARWGDYADPNTEPPRLSFKIQPETEAEANCTHYLVPHLTIPKGWPQSGRVRVGTQPELEDLGYGYITINENNELKVDIMLYTADCPSSGSAAAFTARPETIPPVAAFTANPVADTEDIQRAVLAGLQKDETGNPVNPAFYASMRDILQDMLGLK